MESICEGLSAQLPASAESHYTWDDTSPRMGKMERVPSEQSEEPLCIRHHFGNDGQMTEINPRGRALPLYEISSIFKSKTERVPSPEDSITRLSHHNNPSVTAFSSMKGNPPSTHAKEHEDFPERPFSSAPVFASQNRDMYPLVNYLKARVCPWSQLLYFRSPLLLVLVTVLLSPLTLCQAQELSSTTATTSSTATTTPAGLECYVCLPGDKSSHEAKEILKLFPLESNHSVPDCIAFDSHNAHQFQFTCPPPFNLGCSRKMGSDRSLVSRSCVDFRINDCKIANGAEYCWCTGSLCNGVKELPQIGLPSDLVDSSERNKSDGSNSWKDLTDDEDLLGPNNPYEGSGGYSPEPSPPDNNPNTPKPKHSHPSRTGGTHQRKFFAGSNPPASHNNVPSTTTSGVSRAFKFSYSSSVPSILISLILASVALRPWSFSSL